MYYIGIDLGGTTIKAGVVNEDGEILKTLSVQTGADREGFEIVKSMAEVATKLIEELDIDGEVAYIGIGAPGLIDSENKIIVTASNINFKNINIEKEMKKHIDLPIYLENDANSATVAEFICGSMKGYKNAVMITVGTGVGGGVIINGKLLKGTFLGETEIGHMMVDYSSGEPCGCGQIGCLESFASANSLIKYAKNLCKSNPNNKILEMAKTMDNIDAKVIFNAYDLGDSVAKKAVHRFNQYMAIGIVNLINIFKPGVVCIGGGVSARKEKLTKPIEEIAQNMIYGEGFENKIVAAQLGNDAGIIGAAMLGKVY